MSSPNGEPVSVSGGIDTLFHNVDRGRERMCEVQCQMSCISTSSRSVSHRVGDTGTSTTLLSIHKHILSIIVTVSYSSRLNVFLNMASAPSSEAQSKPVRSRRIAI